MRIAVITLRFKG